MSLLRGAMLGLILGILISGGFFLWLSGVVKDRLADPVTNLREAGWMR